MATAAKQREAKRYEDAEAGRYKPAAPTAALQAGTAGLAAELERARGRQERIKAAVEGLAAGSATSTGLDDVSPGAGASAVPAAVAPQLQRALAHVAVL